MSAVVVDASIVAAWLLNEHDGEAFERLLLDVGEQPLAVPAVWASEVGNVLVVAERRGRLSPAELSRASELVAALEVEVDPVVPARVLGSVVPLARERHLSVYDASYLELAMRLGLTLASLDSRLANAAAAAGVSVR